MALDNDIVAKSGAWFSFGDIRLGQGKENVKARLETEAELLAAIEEKVNQLLQTNTIVVHSSEGEDEIEAEEIIEE